MRLPLITSAFLALFCTKVFAQSLKGGWEMQSESSVTNEKVVMIATKNYLSIAVFESKNYIRTYGGTYEIKDSKLIIKWEFNDKNKDEVGTSTSYDLKIDNNSFTIKNLVATSWKRIDAGNSPSTLAGSWRITARENQEGVMSEMKVGPRKTIKIFSDTRFQWMAINTETKEFFGTGGGTYTLKDGKYTENLEFFSRDNSRVGMSLSFDAKVENGKWQHSGKSSTGNKINEIWVRE